LKYKRLIVNGCSFTACDGDGVTPEINGWPAVLGEKLGAEVTNIRIDEKKFSKFLPGPSTAGGSNDRIIRTTLDWVSQLWPWKEQELKKQIITKNFKDSLFIIGWTEFTRFEMFSNLTKQYLRSSKIRHREWKKEFLNESDQFRKYLEQIIFLQSWFEAHEISYLFFDALENLLSPLCKEYRKNNSNLFQLVNLDNWVYSKGHYWSCKSYLETLCDTKDILSGLTISDRPLREEIIEGQFGLLRGHPNVLGNEKWAEVLYENIRTKKI